MEKIREALKKTIKDLYDLDFEPEIAFAPENIDADYSSNAPLKLAKELHKPPMKIAEELKEYIIKEPHEGGRKEASRESTFLSSPGFINFSLSDDFLFEELTPYTEDFTTTIAIDDFKGKTVVTEFSDPNPFKVLHVGHLYTSIVGDAISRLYESAGAKVIRANFGGDVGLHVAKTIYILLQKNLDALTTEDMGKCYVEGTAAYDDDEKAHAEITKLNKEIYKINAENIHGTTLSDLYWKGRELSYEYFINFYDSIGVKFDKYYPESSVADLGLKTVKKELEKGVYRYSNGAVIFDGDKFGLHTRVFINKEGVPTYEAKDVGLIFQKDKDYHFDKSVVITGNEQLEYMKVVLKSVEQYAPELVAKTSHLTHGLVKLPGNVKMSSRKGNFLKAVDVLNLVRDALQKAYNSTDEAVSLSATKYALLKYKMGGDIIFDPEESVKMTGNSGPYLLYSCVRAKKILATVNEQATTANGTHEIVSRKSTFTDAERNLIKKILEYRVVLIESVHEMAPHKVANFLYEAAQDFSRFYENCPVIGAPEESERVKLVQAYLNVMTHGLNILGINIPEEM